MKYSKVSIEIEIEQSEDQIEIDLGNCQSGAVFCDLILIEKL